MDLFSKFCNICYCTDDGRIENIYMENKEHIKDILLSFLGYPDVLEKNVIYICDKCTEALKSFDKFREMCVKQLIQLRQLYIELKTNLEESKDPNILSKLAGFIDEKVYNKKHDDEIYDSAEVTFQQVHIKKEIKFEYVEDSSEEHDKSVEKISCNVVKMENKQALHTEVELYEENSTEITDLQNFEQGENRINEGVQEGNLRKKKLLQCEFCPKTFQHKSRLIVHERRHTGNKPYICNICNKSFAALFILMKHKKIHVKVRPYKCTLCEMAFARADGLARHEKTHSEVNAFSCSICDKRFIEEKNLRLHERVHLEPRLITCNVCHINFTELNELRQHEKIHETPQNLQEIVILSDDSNDNILEEQEEKQNEKHNLDTENTSKKLLKCQYCPRVYKNQTRLLLHEKIHCDNGTYRCNICFETYSSYFLLTIHKRRHKEGVKPYKCEICLKSFKEAATLRRHTKTHSGIKPYACSFCGKSFLERGNMLQHERFHSPVKDFVCNICGRAFAHSSNLIKHVNGHTEFQKTTTSFNNT